MWHSGTVAIWKATESAPAERVEGPSVATIGVFDGVHRGHQGLLSAVREQAERSAATAVAVTFDPDPVSVLAPQKAPKRLTTIERRVQLLAAHGAQQVRVLDFTPRMASWTPEEFIERVIVEQLGCTQVVVGQDFRFGERATGTIRTLIDAGPSHGFETVGQPLVGDDAAFSSTRVRRAVADADLGTAAMILGRSHEVSGQVVVGDRRGRDLGFPTANIPVDDAYAVPPDGVYAGRLVRSDGSRLPAAVSVGSNPTFEGVVGRRVESYVLDRDDLDLYGEQVRVEFVGLLRSMETFDSVEALVQRMHADVEATRAALDEERRLAS